MALDSNGKNTIFVTVLFEGYTNSTTVELSPTEGTNTLSLANPWASLGFCMADEATAVKCNQDSQGLPREQPSKPWSQVKSQNRNDFPSCSQAHPIHPTPHVRASLNIFAAGAMDKCS